MQEENLDLNMYCGGNRNENTVVKIRKELLHGTSKYRKLAARDFRVYSFLIKKVLRLLLI